MKKRIWASLDDYLPTGNGRHQVGRNIANHTFFKALMKYSDFHEFHFFLTNHAHRRLFEKEHSATLEQIGAWGKVRLFDRLQLAAQLQGCDYTVFHQSDHMTSFNALCYLRNQMASFPVTAFIHSLSYQHFMGKYLEMLLGGATSWDALVCSSHGGKQVIERCFQYISSNLNIPGHRVQMEVIPFGMDGGEYAESDRLGCRKKLGLEENDVIGLCFGRFSDYDKMDHFSLLQAFRAIYQNGRPWRLILAGAVHSESYLKILQLWAQVLGLTERVRFLTNISERDKADLYRAADFFVSLSDNPQETFGLTLLEAMACGLPLLVSDFDGYREIVTDRIGIRIKTIWTDLEPLAVLGPIMDDATYHRYVAQSICVDVEQLADALRFLYSNPTHREEMGRAARQRFLEYYDYRVVIPKLAAFWANLKDNFIHAPDASQVNPTAMNVFDCFSHYVTETLRSTNLLKSTAFGRSLLDSKTNYPLLPEMSNLIDHDHVRELLNQLDEPRPVQELVDKGQNEAWRTIYLLMWMLKHGLLGLVEPSGDARATCPPIIHQS